MKFQQRGLAIVVLIAIVWICLSVFKVHIDIEIVGDEKDHENLHKKDSSNLSSAKDKQRIQPPPRINRPGRDPVKDDNPNELVPPFIGQRNLAPIYVPWSDYESPYRKEKEDELHETYRFNKYLSDRLPMNRDVEDTRPGSCSLQRFPKNMGTVSVVLIYYNEAVSVVFRTIYSVINRSPRRLLHEFVLYDDGSVWEESIGPMKAEAEKVLDVPIRYVRNTTRGGLMRARTSAANFASGDILIYLDSHCEVLPGWLEPLIEPIFRDPTAVTCPVIDTIEWDTMDLVSGRAPMSAIGSYNLLLNYNWYPIPEREQQRRRAEHGKDWAISPIRSAAMAGGLFAINRKYFHDLGAYDTKMNVWGGENTEISIRIWTCGGTLLFAPCSKVGHIFRHGYPYDFMGDHFQTVLFNYKRVAKVWMDADEEFYYKLRPMAREKDVGSVAERLKLRKSLQCKSYEWFINTITPNLVLEKDLSHYGQMKSGYKTNFCIDNLGNEYKGHGLSIGTYPCHPADGAIDNQFMMMTKSGIFRSIDRCMTISSRNVLAMNHCFDYNKSSFTWEYNENDKTLKHMKSGKCLDYGAADMATQMTVVSCNGSDKQQWTFTYNN